MTLLRTSHKYLATDMHKLLLQYLSPILPTTFAQFKLFNADEEALKERVGFDYNTPECYAAMSNTFREIEAWSLLPFTLYRLCRFRINTILRSGLSATNMHAVMSGRSGLAESARADVFYHFFHDHSKWRGCLFCCGDEDCTLNGARFIHSLMEDDLWLDPLQARDFEEIHGVCSGCLRLHSQTLEIERERVWERLPEIFRLLPWKSLLTNVGS